MTSRYLIRTLVFLTCGVPGFALSPAGLMREAAVRSALDAIRREEPNTLDLQASLCRIPAPPFKEARRGRELQRLFHELNLRDVRADRVGNIIGVRPGKSARPNIIFAAHLDTVFPAGAPLNVRRSGNVITGPGISDDCRGLAVLLAVIRALNEAQIETPGTITFVADVGEEGLGDLRGMRQLLGETLKGAADAFVSIDGAGLGITNVGVGSLRYRVTFRGPGGHSYGAFGMANPVQAMGRAIAGMGSFQIPSHPRTTFNVGRVGGGTSVNAIPFEAWMEVDLRSVDPDSLRSLDGQFHAALDRAAAEGNQRSIRGGPVTFTAKVIGRRPAGRTPEESDIVQAALAASEALQIGPGLGEGSTDANLPMSLGMPAITIGGGGTGRGAHSPGETYNAAGSWLGTARALLLAVTLAR